MVVDSRERGNSIPDALVAAGLDVQLTNLPVGDYVIGPGLAVERKGPNDLGVDPRLPDFARPRLIMYPMVSSET